MSDLLPPAVLLCEGGGDIIFICFQHDDARSVMSFTSSIHSVPAERLSSTASAAAAAAARHRQFEAIDAKIEGVNSLVAMLGCHDVEKMSVTFEAMSSSPDNCELMRSNRVVPVLIGVLHSQEVNSPVLYLF